MAGVALPFLSSLNKDVMSGAVVIILWPRGNKAIAKDGKEFHLKTTELIPFYKYEEKDVMN